MLGRHDIGALEVGRRADVVVTDGGLAPLAVMRAEVWMVGGSGATTRT